MKSILKIKNILFVAIAVCLILSVSSCKKDNSSETKISQYSDTESHNHGENCMSCHKSGGSGEGWFKLAGSVYDALKENPYPNTTVRLYAEPNNGGTLIKTIEVDGKGNFYTTETIEFGTGIYVSVTGTSGTVKSMQSKITSGQCNSCHGVSKDRIWVD